MDRRARRVRRRRPRRGRPPAPSRSLGAGRRWPQRRPPPRILRQVAPADARGSAQSSSGGPWNASRLSARGHARVLRVGPQSAAWEDRDVRGVRRRSLIPGRPVVRSEAEGPQRAASAGATCRRIPGREVGVEGHRRPAKRPAWRRRAASTRAADGGTRLARRSHHLFIRDGCDLDLDVDAIEARGRRCATGRPAPRSACRRRRHVRAVHRDRDSSPRSVGSARGVAACPGCAQS